MRLRRPLACQSIAMTWYATAGHDPADVADRRARVPWYKTKATPSTADITAKLRRVLIAARFRAPHPDRGYRITRELYLSRHGPDSIKDRYVMSCMRNARTGY